MDQQTSASSVAAVVVAYNEADRIHNVLEVLCTFLGFSQVIVVDDGSTDETRRAVGAFPVVYLRVDPNQGKGHALDVGVKGADASVIFFADADIVGLTHRAIEQIVGPVLDGSAEMFIAMRNRKIYYLRALMGFIPLLGGERALTKKLWEELPAKYKSGFKIEAGLNFYAVHFGRGLRFRIFKEIKQTIKERKYGLKEGLRRRFRMLFEVGQAVWEVQFEDAPRSLRSRRHSAFNVMGTVLGIVVGSLLLVSAAVGPAELIQKLFAEELLEDPGAPLARVLLALSHRVSVSIIAAVGGLLLLSNLAFFALSLLRLTRSGTTRSEG